MSQLRTFGATFDMTENPIIRIKKQAGGFATGLFLYIQNSASSCRAKRSAVETSPKKP